MRSRTSRRSLRLTLGGLLLLVASCHYCPGPPPGQVSPRLASVVVAISLELTPDVALLQPQAEQQFQVTGRLADGTAVPLSAVWTATGGSITSAGLYHAGTIPGTYRVIARNADNTLADTATVTIVAPQLIAIKIAPASATLTATTSQMFTATGQYSDGTSGPVSVTWSATGGAISQSGLYAAGATVGTFQVVATSAEGLSDTAPVTVKAPPTGLFVQISGVPTTQDKWLLQDTDIGVPAQAACPSDVATRYSAADLPITDLWPSCPTELSGFAADAAPVLDLSPTSVVSGGRNLILEPLPAPWVVKLRVIYEYAGGDIDAVIGMDKANLLYHDNRMGLTVKIADGPDFISPDPDLTGKVHPTAVAIKAGCQAVADAGLVADDRISVFLVAQGQWPPAGVSITRYGYNCSVEHLPGIVFLREAHVPETLAHEIGHGLSLVHAGIGNQDSGWAFGNVMQSSVFYPNTPWTIKYFTLGQVYRANFNKISWINLSKTRVALTKECQPGAPNDVTSTWPCPSIQVSWP